MNPVVITKTLAAASANNIALSQTPVSGTNLTIAGSAASGGVATLDSARRVLVTFGVEGSARTLVVTGTNETGNPISETVAIASGAGSTVSTLQDYLTVTTLTPAGGGWTAAVTVGTSGVGSTPWKVVDIHLAPVQIAFNLNITGTINCGIEYTYDAVPGQAPNVGNLPWTYPTAPQAILHPTLQAVTASADGSLGIPFRAWRMTINSGTGTVIATSIKAGIAQ